MTEHTHAFTRIGIIGFGEVGRIFAAGLNGKAGIASLAAWDTRWRDAPPNPEDIAVLNAANTHVMASAEALCESSDLIISAVTAANTRAVIDALAPKVRTGLTVLDLNSASPGTKQACAEIVHARGGAYVEAGVMTSVPPYGIAVPMLLGGPHAAAFSAWANARGLSTTVASDTLGVASAIKMCRSIMIKGLEALIIESYTTARTYGVEDAMIPTLAETFPTIDWEKQGDYFFQRVVQHGARRTEEMREAAATVRETGLEPLMTTAIADRQAWVVAQRKAGIVSPGNKPWREHADALIAARKT